MSSPILLTPVLAPIAAVCLASRSPRDRPHSRRARAFRCCVFRRRCARRGAFSVPTSGATSKSAARAHDLDPMVLAGMIFIESYGDPQAKSPTGPAGIAQMTKGSARELGLSTGKESAHRHEGRQENAMGRHGQEPAEGRADGPAAGLQDDRRALRSRARDQGDGAAREQSPIVARRQRRFRDRRIPHGRRPDGEAAVGVFRAHGACSDVPAEMRGAGSFVPGAVLDEHAVLPSRGLPGARRAQSRRLLADLLLPRAAGDAPARDVPPVARRVRAARVCVSGAFRMDGAAELRSGALSTSRCAARCRRRLPAGELHQDVSERFVLLPDIASRLRRPRRRAARCRPSARRSAPRCSSRTT